MPRKNILTHSKKKKALALTQANRLEEAKQLYAQICAIDKLDGEAWFNLGAVNGLMGRHPEAEACSRKATALDPKNVKAHYNLGIACRDQGKSTEAVEAFDTAYKLAPSDVNIMNDLALGFLALGKLDETAEILHKAIKISPLKIELHQNLGFVYQRQGLMTQAEACYQEAHRLNPNGSAAYENMGSVLSSQGRSEEAVAWFRKGLDRNPGDVKAHSNLLLCLNYLSDQNPETIFNEHRAWASIHARIATATPSHVNNRDPDRRLRIGYVSQDFRVHSVASFIEPILKAHDRKNFEIFCYAHIRTADATTDHLRSMTDHWQQIDKASDAEVVNQIRTDEIDILVDLAGHTGGSRLLIFTHKPAPIQVTYIGYPNTTGLSTMDYRLTDAFADPTGSEEYYTEKLIRLPGCFLCYAPPPNAPPITSLPAIDNNFITFGSFNNLAKINNQVIKMWAEIVQAIPDAKLLIKNPSLTDPKTREAYYDIFAKSGLPRKKVELLGHTPTREQHMALYGRVDIALDTFPYNGTTTTCEAFWMGVPVISLTGKSHAGRVTTSLLNAVGLNEFITDTRENYLQCAVDLAGDRERLTSLRASLRDRVRDSALSDEKRFTSRVEAAYRQMWQTWCKG